MTFECEVTESAIERHHRWSYIFYIRAMYYVFMCVCAVYCVTIRMYCILLPRTNESHEQLNEQKIY